MLARWQARELGQFDRQGGGRFVQAGAGQQRRLAAQDGVLGRASRLRSGREELVAAPCPW